MDDSGNETNRKSFRIVVKRKTKNVHVRNSTIAKEQTKIIVIEKMERLFEYSFEMA